MGDPGDEADRAARTVRNEVSDGAVVVGGLVQTGSFTGRVHFHYQERGAPDLLAVRLWVDRIAADYQAMVEAKGDKDSAAHLKRVRAVRASLEDSPEASGRKDVIRRLIVAGVSSYLAHARELPSTPLPRQIPLDFLVFCLWPVITAKNLPQGWQGDLAEITSTRLAALVENVRATGRSGDEAAARAFARAVARGSFDPAIVALFDDLADPRRGGALLTSMAVAGGLSKPPGGRGRKVFAWAVGIVGGAAALDAVLDHGSHLGQLFDSAIDGLVGDALSPAELLASFLEELSD